MRRTSRRLRCARASWWSQETPESGKSLAAGGQRWRQARRRQTLPSGHNEASPPQKAARSDDDADRARSTCPPAPVSPRTLPQNEKAARVGRLKEKLRL